MKAYELFLLSSGITIDTRHVYKNQLFVALKGPNFNGNRFVEDALNQGAIGAIVDDEEAVVGENCILVKDCLKCLQHMALKHRERFTIPVIGLTGSNGKTTVKELLQRGLSSQINVLATKGNFNNHIGVPLTLLRITKDHDIAIVEMGANHQGEIKSYCSWAKPSHGLITNIGKAHLEGFGGLEGVLQGKMELFDAVCSSGGEVFYPYAEEGIAKKLGNYTHTTTFGIEPSADFSLPIEINGDILQYCDRQKKTPFQLKGRFNRNNVIGAAALCKHFSIRAEDYLQPLLEYSPQNNRSQYLERNKATIVLDAYNANPSSMRASIDGFMARPGKKILILGEMKELGEYSKEEHQALVDYLQALDISESIFFGDEFSQCVMAENQTFYANKGDLKEHLVHQSNSPCSILIKGSRSCKLEELID